MLLAIVDTCNGIDVVTTHHHAASLAASAGSPAAPLAGDEHFAQVLYLRILLNEYLMPAVSCDETVDPVHGEKMTFKM